MFTNNVHLYFYYNYSLFKSYTTFQDAIDLEKHAVMIRSDDVIKMATHNSPSFSNHMAFYGVFSISLLFVFQWVKNVIIILKFVIHIRVN